MRLDHLLSMETGTECHDSVIRVKTRSVHRQLGTDLLLFNFQGPETILEKEKSPWYGGVAQLGEHLPCKQGVMGSNPIISTTGQCPAPLLGEVQRKLRSSFPMAKKV